MQPKKSNQQMVKKQRVIRPKKSNQQTMKRQRDIVKISKSKTNIFKKEILQYLDNNGYLSWSLKEKKYLILGTNSPKNGLVQCPQCKFGELMVIRSKTTRKRFMGCSNFHGGCKASSPLLQKAKLRATKKPCIICQWPMIIFRYSRKQKWIKQCSNFSCKSRKIKPSS